MWCILWPLMCRGYIFRMWNSAHQSTGVAWKYVELEKSDKKVEWKENKDGYSVSFNFD